MTYQVIITRLKSELWKKSKLLCHNFNFKS